MSFSIIHFVEKANQVSIDALLQVMEIAKVLRCTDLEFYVIILRLIARFKHAIKGEQATRAWDLLRTSGLALSEVLYSYILALFRYADVSKSVYELACEGLEKGCMTKNNTPSTIYFLSYRSLNDLAIGLVIKAHQKGIFLPNVIYDIIKAEAISDLGNAFNLLHKVMDAKITLDPPTLSAVMYQVFTATDHVAREPYLVQLVDLLKILKYSYEHLIWDIIDFYAQKDMHKQVEPFLRDWFTTIGYPVPSTEKIEHNLGHYTRSKKPTLRSECAMVVEVIGVLRKQYGLVPSGRIYLILLSAYDKLGNLPEIVRLLMEMESNDCSRPQAHIIALEAAAKSKNIEVGQMLYQLAKGSHKTPMPSLYTAALKIAVQCDTLDWARSVFEELLKQNPSPAQAQLPYDMMITALMSRDHLDDALELLNQMEERGKPTAESYFKILVRLIELGNNSLANAKMRSALHRNISFTPAQRAAFVAAHDTRASSSAASSDQSTNSSSPQDQQTGESEVPSESSSNFENYYMENYPYSDSDQYLDDQHPDDQPTTDSTHYTDAQAANNEYATEPQNYNNNARVMDHDPNIIIEVPAIPPTPTNLPTGLPTPTNLPTSDLHASPSPSPSPNVLPTTFKLPTTILLSPSPFTLSLS
jgi:pentatricopeptide repeat protein